MLCIMLIASIPGEQFALTEVHLTCTKTALLKVIMEEHAQVHLCRGAPGIAQLNSISHEGVMQAIGGSLWGEGITGVRMHGRR